MEREGCVDIRAWMRRVSQGGHRHQWLPLGRGGGWLGTGEGKRHTFPLVLLELNHVYYLKPFYLEKSQDSSYSSMEGLLLDGRKDFLGSGRRLKRSWHSGLC